MALDPDAAGRAVAAIEAAFGSLMPPGDAALLHPRCMDDNDIAEFYGTPDWRDLPDDLLVRNYAALSFFSAEAFRYYLPAFMVWSLRHSDSPEYLVEATLRAFDPGSDAEALRAFQVSKFTLFDAAQRRAVVAFLGRCGPRPARRSRPAQSLAPPARVDLQGPSVRGFQAEKCRGHVTGRGGCDERSSCQAAEQDPAED